MTQDLPIVDDLISDADLMSMDLENLTSQPDASQGKENMSLMPKSNISLSDSTKNSPMNISKKPKLDTDVSGTPASNNKAQVALDDLFNADLTNENEDDDAIEFGALMKLYYQKLFPFSKFHKWLSYNSANRKTFGNREFSFTIRDERGAEIYLRFCSFQTMQDFKDDIIRKVPEKIDIGAIYSAQPAVKNTLKPGSFVPLERELVFDIDMTDYDDIRTCCQGAAVCSKCWKFMNVALKILKRSLTKDFGFKHILYVYSGRRGIHLWVCDERARKLSEEARKSIVSYLEVVKGGEQMNKKVNIRNIHPFISRSYKIINEYFEEVVLLDQDVLNNEKMAEKMLSIVPEERLRTAIRDKWKTLKTSKDKWIVLEKFINALKSDNSELDNLIMEIKFQYLYPRLDAQVSMHLNHLLKSPFCVHPKTGRVCVPIDVNECDNFNPTTVPTASGLLKQLAEYKVTSDGTPSKEIHDWEKTDLKPYMKLMDKFLKDMDQENRSSAAKKKDDNEKNLAF